MKRLTLSTLLLMLTLWVAAQNTLTGKVIDASTRQPIEFANVSLVPQGQTVPTDGAMTDVDGAFELKHLKSGNYVLTVSFVGYQELKKNVSMNGTPVLLGRLALKEDTQALQEVEVVGQSSSMRFELDKKIFTVDQNIAAAGASISEALENIPSVDVDQEGNISLRNSENVEIWINGKPSGLTAENRAQILQQMPADSIKEIEIITNPSAKHSPEGTAGVINLVMKKDRKAGYYGSVQAGINYGLAAPWTVPPGANIGVNLNVNKGIMDAYINAGYRFNTGNGGSFTDRYNMDGEGFGTFDPEKDAYTSHLLQSGQNDRRGHGMFLRAGIDFRLSEHSSLGASGFGMVSDPKAFRELGTTTNSYLLTEATGDTARIYERRQSGNGWHPGGNVRVDYRFEYEKHKLSLSASYNHFTWNQDNYYTQVENLRDTMLQEQTNGNLDQSVEVKADYEWKPTQSSRLEAGYQTTLAWRNSEADAWNGHDREQELYNYFTTFHNEEQNHAIYITYGNRWWNKLSLQVGLRGEYFIRHLAGQEKDTAGQEKDIYAGRESKQDTAYFQLYPSAYLSYDFGHGHELQLNYTRRVNRPRGHQINPRRDFSDSTNISFGNPDLLPSFSNNLELNYLKAWERHTLSAGLFWRMEENIIQSVRYMDGTTMKSTFTNLANRHELGAEIVAKNKLFGEVLQLTTSANLYWNKITDGVYDNMINGEHIVVQLPGNQALSWSARINAQFLFTKTFTGQLSANYRSPRVLAQGKTTHNYSIDLGLRKTFLDRKLALAFNVRDILDSRSRRSTTWGNGFWQESQRRWHSRSVSLTLTYNFGSQNRRKGNQRPEGEGGGMNDYSGMEEDF